MEFYNKNGNKLPQVLLNGIPFNEKDLEANAFEETVVNKIMKVTSDIQMAYYNGQLNEHHNVVDWLMGKDVIMPRLNPRILSTTKEFVNINGFDADADAFVSNLKYLKQSGLDKFHSLTIWAVCDPDTEQGRMFLSNAVEFFDSNQNTRLGILFQSTGQNSLIKNAILYALDNFHGDEAIGFIKKIIKENIFDELIKSTKTFDQIEVKVSVSWSFVRLYCNTNFTRKILIFKLHLFPL
jgi:UDP-glucose:glycoprotein glucosyltransferase